MRASTHKLPRFLHLSIVALTAVCLGGCQPSKSSTDRFSMTPLSPRLASIFERTKIVCFGRFVLEVPATAIVVFGPTDAETSVKYLPNKASELTQRVDQQLRAIESDRQFLTEKDHARLPLFGKVINGAAPGQKLLIGSEDQAGYSMYSFFPKGDHLYVHELGGGVIGAAGVESATKFLNDIATRLRLRASDEVPTDLGMCIDGGFVPLDMQYEKATVGIRFNEFPDVHFSVEALKNQEFLPEASDLESLLVRAEKNAILAGTGAAFSKIRTLRRGSRKLNLWMGFEILARKPPFRKDTDAHEFRFRSLGEPDNAYLPQLDVQLDTGVKNNTKAAVKPSITDEEAVALWDKLTGSIGVRPQGGKPESESISSNAELSTRTVTGALCPETGWWECTHSGIVEGPRRRHFVEGEPLPYIVVAGDANLWQKLTGRLPNRTTTTAWELVSHTTTGKASH